MFLYHELSPFFFHSFFLSPVPIGTINFSDPADFAKHDRMVTLVGSMLDLNKKVQDARLEQEKTLLSWQIAAPGCGWNTKAGREGTF